MNNQEYYENHFLIDGKKPPPLRDWQKKLFELYDLAQNNPEVQGVVVVNGKKAGYGLIFKSVQAKLEFEGTRPFKHWLQEQDIKSEARNKRMQEINRIEVEEFDKRMAKYFKKDAVPNGNFRVLLPKTVSEITKPPIDKQ